MPVEYARPDAALAVEGHRLPGDFNGTCPGIKSVVADQPQADTAALEQIAAVSHDGIEHRLSVGQLAADHAKNFSGCRLLLERFFGFIEQPYVLDRDHSLFGEGLQELNLLI